MKIVLTFVLFMAIVSAQNFTKHTGRCGANSFKIPIDDLRKINRLEMSEEKCVRECQKHNKRVGEMPEYSG